MNVIVPSYQQQYECKVCHVGIKIKLNVRLKPDLKCKAVATLFSDNVCLVSGCR